MGGLNFIIIGLLSALSAGLFALLIVERRRIRRLTGQIEDFLSASGAPLAISVQEGPFAMLHNAAAELENRLILAREQQKEECARTSSLTADISHQLKTPLASLRLFCEMDEGAHIAEQISQIERMELLTHSLLRLERLCADGYEFRFAPSDVRAIVLSAWNSLEEVYSGRNLSIDGDAQIRCDAKWLGEALLNLLKNACEYTPAGGSIRVTLESTAAACYIAVEDEGGGVSPKELPRLFERFYRAKGLSEQGTGIGLAIVREIIRRHHGDIYAENTEKGLRMRVSLPIYSLLKS